MASIGLEHTPVIDAERSVLIFLARDTIAGNQEFDVGSHKAAERVFRGTDDRLASDIEAGVHESRAAGARLEGGEQRVITRVRLSVNCLDTRRHVDMSNGRNLQLLSREIPWLEPGIDNDKSSVSQTRQDLRVGNAGVPGIGLVRPIEDQGRDAVFLARELPGADQDADEQIDVRRSRSRV